MIWSDLTVSCRERAEHGRPFPSCFDRIRTGSRLDLARVRGIQLVTLKFTGTPAIVVVPRARTGVERVQPAVPPNSTRNPRAPESLRLAERYGVNVKSAESRHGSSAGARRIETQCRLVEERELEPVGRRAESSDRDQSGSGRSGAAARYASVTSVSVKLFVTGVPGRRWSRSDILEREPVGVAVQDAGADR